MILYPAIDLKGGQCVRLLRGDMAQATVFNTDPAAQAREFVDQGATYLHIVDLDGAVAGKAINGDAVRAILAVAREKGNVSVQLGGGIRNRSAAETWLESGVTRVILGTAALHDRGLVADLCREFPGRIVVGIDARGNKVAAKGWVEQSEVDIANLAVWFKGAGVAAFIYTDIDRDGALQGPNFTQTERLASLVAPVEVIASGGVTRLDDIRIAKARGIPGAIIGRALYEGRITLRDALKAAG